MSHSESTRIRELERRVDTLTYVAVVQAVGLGFLLQLVPIAALSVLFLLPILAFTHKRIPAFARRIGRLFSSVFGAARNSSDSVESPNGTLPS
ncbi:MAG: hypothetical protein V4719_02090 [Planctomycetota bacterium]|jgi:hypothetical protein